MNSAYRDIPIDSELTDMLEEMRTQFKQMSTCQRNNFFNTVRKIAQCYLTPGHHAVLFTFNSAISCHELTGINASGSQAHELLDFLNLGGAAFDEGVKNGFQYKN